MRVLALKRAALRLPVPMCRGADSSRPFSKNGATFTCLLLNGLLPVPLVLVRLRLPLPKSPRPVLLLHSVLQKKRKLPLPDLGSEKITLSRGRPLELLGSRRLLDPLAPGVAARLPLILAGFSPSGFSSFLILFPGFHPVFQQPPARVLGGSELMRMVFQASLHLLTAFRMYQLAGMVHEGETAQMTAELLAVLGVRLPPEESDDSESFEGEDDD